MADCFAEIKTRKKKCDRYEDQGHFSDECLNLVKGPCLKLEEHCCEWQPCKFFCDVITSVCVLFGDAICTAFRWIENIVCAAWVYVIGALCVGADIMNTAVSAIIETVESIIIWFTDVIAAFIDLILSIPYVGPALRIVIKFITGGVWTVISIVGAFIDATGILPEKKLRICPIMLCREPSPDPRDLAQDREAFVQAISEAMVILREQTNVRIIRSAPFQYSSGLLETGTADADWINYHCPPDGNPDEILDIRCDKQGYWNYAGLTGSKLHIIANFKCFYGNTRRLLGYGAPIVVFLVRNIDNYNTDSQQQDDGCAPRIVDHVFLRHRATGHTLAHELGHKCNLEHTSDPDNLMTPAMNGNSLTFWQTLLFRSSTYVTFF